MGRGQRVREGRDGATSVPPHFWKRSAAPGEMASSNELQKFISVMYDTACEEVHHVPDDDVIKEENAAETQTAESAGDVAASAAEYINDSVSTAASSEPSCVNSQQDNT